MVSGKASNRKRRPRLEDFVKSFVCSMCRQKFVHKTKAHIHLDGKIRWAVACTGCLPRSQAICYNCGRVTVKREAAYCIKGSYLCADCDRFIREHPDLANENIAAEIGMRLDLKSDGQIKSA